MAAEISKTPTRDASVNKPSSGTYGEKADLNRLKQALPDSGARPGAGPAGPSPMGGPGVGGLAGPEGRPPGMTPPPGVPGALMHPTDRPNQPLSTPRVGAGPPMGGASSAQEARLVVLQSLAESDTVSDATREWAANVLEMLSNG